MILSEIITRAAKLCSSGLERDAIELYQDWLNANSSGRQSALARFNLAVLLTEQGHFAGAEKELKLAIQESPKFAQAYFNLGLNLERQSRPEEAIATWLTAINLLKASKTPEDKDLLANSFNQIGRLQESLKNYDEAEYALCKSLSVKQHQPDAIQHLVHLRQKKCAWEQLEQPLELSYTSQQLYISPLAALAHSDSPLTQQLSAMSFHLRKYPFNTPTVVLPNKRTTPVRASKIRIGFVSGDLCTHAVGLLLPEFLKLIDRQQFELIAFDYSPEDGSKTRKDLKNIFQSFMSIKGASDDQAAELIGNSRLDVLFDLHALSSGARPKIFAQRPCRNQVSWLGYIGTTTFPWIDYVLTDRVAFPNSLRNFYTEAPLYLAGSFLPINQLGQRKHLKRRLEKGESVTIGCLNNVYKLSKDVFECWMRIVRDNKNVTMVLLDDNKATTDKLKSTIKNLSVPEGRVKFFKRGTYASYLQQIENIDIYLDTYPYCAGSTARDVVNCGTLMVTLKGTSMVSRMGASILRELSFDNLVANDLEEYESLIGEMIKDLSFKNYLQEDFELKLKDLPSLLRKNVTSFESLMKSVA